MNKDFQKVVDSIAAMTCVVSVEKLPDGGCGQIRIVTGNKDYIDSIEHPVQDVVMLTKSFVPNSLYTTYMPRDLNFEDFCYRAAVQKKCLHSYAHPDRYDVWFNMTFMPLGPDDGNLCYCTYTMEISFEPSSERISYLRRHRGIGSGDCDQASRGERLQGGREGCRRGYPQAV